MTDAATWTDWGLVLLELTRRPAFAGSLQEVITAKLGRDPRVPVASTSRGRLIVTPGVETDDDGRDVGRLYSGRSLVEDCC